jgi:hypothetical protein
MYNTGIDIQWYSMILYLVKSLCERCVIAEIKYGLVVATKNYLSPRPGCCFIDFLVHIYMQQTFSRGVPYDIGVTVS